MVAKYIFYQTFTEWVRQGTVKTKGHKTIVICVLCNEVNIIIINVHFNYQGFEPQVNKET